MHTWRKLEAEFKELGKQMAYTRLDVQWGAGGEFWHLAGNFDKNTNKRFTALSSIAGQMLASVLNPSVEAENELLREPNHAIRWYKGIWKISQNFEFGFIGEQTNNDGTSAGHIYTGTIDKIADASATFCLELAARYPDAEEGEKILVPPSEFSESNLRRGIQSNKPEDSKVDKFSHWAKNHSVISILIIIGIVVISLAHFTDAINKLLELFPFLHHKTAIESKKESFVGNAINVNPSNNVIINQTQNFKIDMSNTAKNRLKEDLTIKKEAFELETRPWVSLAISDVSIIGNKIKLKCTIENTGKLPAVNTHIYVGYKIEGQEDIFEKIRNNLDKMPPGSLTAIAPGSKSIHDYNFDIIVKDNTRYYLIALANYDGPKRSGYYTEFCAYIDFPSQTAFGCSDHNIMK